MRAAAAAGRSPPQRPASRPPVPASPPAGRARQVLSAQRSPWALAATWQPTARQHRTCKLGGGENTRTCATRVGIVFSHSTSPYLSPRSRCPARLAVRPRTPPPGRRRWARRPPPGDPRRDLGYPNTLHVRPRLVRVPRRTVRGLGQAACASGAYPTREAGTRACTYPTEAPGRTCQLSARRAHSACWLLAARGGELEQARGEAGAAVALLVEHGGGATQQRQREGGAAEAEEHRAVISRDLRVVRRQAVRAREERQRGGIISTARGGERGEEVRLGVDGVRVRSGSG